MVGPIKKRQSLHERVRAGEARIDALEKQIRKTQKLASLGTLSCLVAHEFNNLLTPIVNYARLALRNPDDTPLVQKALQKALKQGDVAAHIVQSMLGFARDDASSVETVRITQLVDECFQCLARDLSKDRITVACNIPHDLTVEVSPGLLQQVILNLIINARHAMLERGGTLTIEAGLLDFDTLRVTVADTGCGMPEEVLGRIFEPFFSTKGDSDDQGSGGSGLGLSVCRDIIESYNGTIDVASSPGEGTTFTLTIPTSHLASTQSQSTAASAAT